MSRRRRMRSRESFVPGGNIFRNRLRRLRPAAAVEHEEFWF
ncbi:hypothetical protein J2Z69_003176 [Paenibacillus shirakamiensis]|uniref:Uncharacterized protein n=1 Tax=Paenibacillus shirakamiensis TaxID=1265935 RepID=A0ABS4JK84_9BACL|nr:hypothetical protein [Paenibacillus shirakamiensis]MBP2002119.1 hypothetical protein [Paenibacillus shirakamiensis]